MPFLAGNPKETHAARAGEERIKTGCLWGSAGVFLHGKLPGEIGVFHVDFDKNVWVMFTNRLFFTANFTKITIKLQNVIFG